jgi:hypothetical protein
MKEINQKHIMCWDHWKDTPVEERVRLLKQYAPKRIQAVSHPVSNLIGSGEVHYRHGIMKYCDDGNGNVWDVNDDDGEDDY